MLLPTWVVALKQLGGQLLNTQALAGEQYDEVIEHIRTLIDQAVVGAVGGLDDQLKSLLTYLLRHAVQAVLEQRGGVAALGHLLMTLLDEVLQLAEEEQGIVLAMCGITLVGLAPASVGTCMAYRTCRHGLDQESVLIAVVQDFLDGQSVARGLTLGPQTIAGTTPEGYQIGGNGLLVCLLVHESQHQYLVGICVLDDGRNQPTEFVKIDFHKSICGF